MNALIQAATEYPAELFPLIGIIIKALMKLITELFTRPPDDDSTPPPTAPATVNVSGRGKITTVNVFNIYGGYPPCAAGCLGST